jgi:hypothetical protein
MIPINRESKTSIHFGVNFVFAGAWGHEKGALLNFQRALLEGGLEFSQATSRSNGFTLVRAEPSALQVGLEATAPQVHTLQLIAGNPQYELEMFGRDCEAVTAAYQKTWPMPQYQILNTGGCIRHLYSTKTHAFQYLWEQRLGQAPQDFALLGNRPVAGGGLRLVIPPHQKDNAEPTSIELRIESFMRETQKLFVETVFNWPRPRIVIEQQSFQTPARLAEIESFAANDVWDFIAKQQSGE